MENELPDIGELPDVGTGYYNLCDFKAFFTHAFKISVYISETIENPE